MTKQEENFIMSALVVTLFSEGLANNSLGEKVEKALEESGLKVSDFDDLQSMVQKVMYKEQFGDIDMTALTPQELQEGEAMFSSQLEDIMVELSVGAMEMLLESMEGLK